MSMTKTAGFIKSLSGLSSKIADGSIKLFHSKDIFNGELKFPEPDGC